MNHREFIEKNLEFDQDIFRKIENYIHCPRCKQNLRCYRRNILSLNRKECKKVCDHCLNEYLFHKRSKTTEIDRKSISRPSTHAKYNKDKVKLWLSRIIDLLENNLILYKTANISKQAERKALKSTESRYKHYGKIWHEPKLDQMFDLNKDHLKETTDKAYLKPSTKKQRFRDLDSGAQELDIKDAKSNIENLYDTVTDNTSADDVTLSLNDSRFKQQLMQDKLDVLRRVILEETAESSSKIDHEKYRRIHTAKKRSTLNDQKVKGKEIHVHYLPSKRSSETGVDDTQMKLPYISLKRFNSLESLKSITATAEKTIEHNFSYFFPLEEQSKKYLPHKSSSEIIKETIEMLSERAKLEKKRIDEEIKRKLEEEEKKHLNHVQIVKRRSEVQKVIMMPEPSEGKQEITSANNRYEKESTKSKSIKSAKDKPSVENASSKPTEKSVNVKRKRDKSEALGTDVVIEESLNGKIKKEKQEYQLKPTKEKPSKDVKKKEMLGGEPSEKTNDKPSKDMKNDKQERLVKEKERKLKETVEEEENLILESEKKAKKVDKIDKNERLTIEHEHKLKDNEEKEKFKNQKNIQVQEEKEQHQVQIQQLKNVPKSKVDTVKEKLALYEKGSEKQGDSEKMKKEIAEKQQKEEAFLKMAAANMQDEVKKEVPKTVSKKDEDAHFKELNISKIKLRKPSQDPLILQLVKLKQEEKSKQTRPERLSQININQLVFKTHQKHKTQRENDCLLCNDSELELEVDNIIFTEKKGDEKMTDAIVGENIVRVLKTALTENTKLENTLAPLLFKSTFIEEEYVPKTTENVSKEPSKQTPVSQKRADQEPPKGVIRYALSDRSFIEKGWTMLPTEKVVRKMNVYRMRPAHPEFDWFEHNKNKKLMSYDTGEKLAEFDDDGKGRWYYRNGRIALDYYDAEEINAQQRFVIYSNGEPDERGRPRPFTILATFDYLGNGVVFDHNGKIRLKYNQTEGVVLDKSIGPVSHWKWHTLNDPPVLQQVMIDTQMAHKDPDILKLGGQGDDKPRQDNEEMLAIEFDNFIKEKSKKLSQKFKPFQIKMKALKINENFSLKVLDQATVYLIFRDGSTNLKLNMGMILDHKEIVDTDTAEVGEVSNSLERFPAKTDSLAGLQKSVAHAQRVERSRVERERRLRPSQSYTSADKLTAAASRPLRTPFRASAPISTVTSTRECRCTLRKPALCNIYYDTRLV